MQSHEACLLAVSIYIFMLFSEIQSKIGKIYNSELHCNYGDITCMHLFYYCSVLLELFLINLLLYSAIFQVLAISIILSKIFLYHTVITKLKDLHFAKEIL